MPVQDAERSAEGLPGRQSRLNGQAGKPHRALHVGDQLRITRAAGRRQQIIVKALAEQHLPKAEARVLYEDVTPPPTPEELAAARTRAALLESPAHARDGRARPAGEAAHSAREGRGAGARGSGLGARG